MSEQQIRPATDEEMADIRIKCDLAFKRLGIAAESTPSAVVEAADAFVDAQQIDRSKYFKGLYLLMFRPPDAIIAEIGAAWGEQIVRAFGWRWQYAVRAKEFERAIIAPDRAFIVFPDSYLERMLKPPYDDVTLMLMFNMIEAQNLPEVSAGAMEDISDGRLRHIIPKR